MSNKTKKGEYLEELLVSYLGSTFICSWFLAENDLSERGCGSIENLLDLSIQSLCKPSFLSNCS